MVWRVDGARFPQLPVCHAGGQGNLVGTQPNFLYQNMCGFRALLPHCRCVSEFHWCLEECESRDVEHACVHFAVRPV